MREIKLQKPIMIYRVYEPVKIISNIEKINHQKKVIDRLSRKIQKLKQDNTNLKGQILINKKKNHMILLHNKIIERYIGDDHE